MERWATVRDKLKNYRPGHLLGSFALGCLLSAGQWGGLYAPWSVAFVAARGASPRGFGALLGALLGGYLFFPFQEALRHGATVLLAYAAALSFAGSRWERQRRFAPLCGCLSVLIVHSVYLIGRGPFHTALWLTAGVAVYLLTKQMQGVTLRQQTEVIALGLCLALYGITIDGFSPGRLGAVWLALWLTTQQKREGGVPVGTFAGFSLDLAATRPTGLLGPIFAVACCGVSCCRGRVSKALVYCTLIGGLAVLFDYDEVAPLLFESFTAAAAYLLTPAQERQGKAALPQYGYEPRAGAFRALYDALFGQEGDTAEENPAVIFDRAAEKVCRACPRAGRCYHHDYQSTHDAFTHAAGRLLRRGQGTRGDFPDWFVDSCERFTQFLSAVNDELYAYLLRSRYHRRLRELRQLAALPYAQLGEAMETVPAAAATRAALEVSYAMRPKEGNSVCGDETDVFTVGGVTYLLLSDGMGSGEAAHAESAMTTRLLRQFLEAGITAEASLQTLNTALRLRGGDSFTTIDLGLFHRDSGRLELHKYGACHSFCYRCGEGRVEKIACSTLPAGLETRPDIPAPMRLQLRHGDVLLMISDGVLDAGDEPLQKLLKAWDGPMSELAHAVLELCRDSDDDCAVIVARCRRAGVKRV